MASEGPSVGNAHLAVAAGAVGALAGAAASLALNSLLHTPAPEDGALRRPTVDPTKHIYDELDVDARAHLRRAIASGAQAPTLRAEQLSRNRQYFEDEGQDLIEDAFVVVVGLGGVGSHATNMLVRAGVKRVRLVDFDNVSLSSLNRHATATRADVGTPKVQALRDHLLQVCPWCEIDARVAIFRGDDADDLLSGKPDLVLDCIDDTTTKAQLLVACDRLGLRCISSLGAGGKSDFTRVHLSRLRDCFVDPMAPRLRYKLRQEITKSLGLWIDRSGEEGEAGAAAAASVAEAAAALSPEDAAAREAGLRKAEETAERIVESTDAVFSSEPAVRSLLPLADAQAENPDDFGLLAGFRLRVIPVLGTMPALFGQAIAGHALCQLGRLPIAEPLPAPRVSTTMAAKLVNRLRARLTKVFKVKGNAPEMDLIHNGSVEHLYQVVWEGRDAVGSLPEGAKAKLVMTRWDRERPAALDNIVLAHCDGADRLDREGNGWVSPKARAYVEGRLAMVRAALSQGERATAEAAEAFRAAMERGTADEAPAGRGAAGASTWAVAGLAAAFAAGCAVTALVLRR